MVGNALHYGDNLAVLREHIATESVDLIYLDPPFNSRADYNILFRNPTGERSHAQIEAFEDTWHWSDEAEAAFDDVMRGRDHNVADMLRALRSFLGENDMMAYLAMMTVRLVELHRVLRPTGSLYFHCDPTASHYIKIMMDSIFGYRHFRNEVIWKRTGAHGRAKRWGPVHDTLLFYTRGDRYTWNRNFERPDATYLQSKYNSKDGHGLFQPISLTGPGTRSGSSGMPWRGLNPGDGGRHWGLPPDRALPPWFVFPDGYAQMTCQDRLDALDAQGLIYWPLRGKQPRFKRYAEIVQGNPIQDVITDIAALNSQAGERLSYPTQKPVALLERILAASSNVGDIVLDPFCGCGTAVHAAQKLDRHWIGIDVTHLAISLIEKRLSDAFPGIAYEVHGTPKDIDGAAALAADDKYQFQWWAVSLVNAVPYGGKKKGADGGIDGIVYFKPDARTTEKAIVSVKAGANINVGMIRDLGHVVDREKAKVGIFITLAEPTGPMRTEAVKAGFYETEHGRFPKLQILTIAELFNGKRPSLPWLDPRAFKKAPREIVDRQAKLRFG